MKPFFTFLTYHNAVPIAFGVLFLSVGGALAASPELRSGVAGAVLSTTETVRSADNSYIAAVDLNTFEPKIQITAVTEDEENYYVAYALSTIDIADYVWKEVTKETTLKVAKADLGEKDLGLYVTEELREVADSQLAYLKEVQRIERSRGVSQKVVETAYSGLVGKFLDPKEEVLPGYIPVKPPEPEPSQKEQQQTEGTQPVIADAAIPSSTSTDTISPVITILGNNPATDTYTTTDQTGNSATATLTVTIVDPNPATTTTSTSSASSTTTITTTTDSSTTTADTTTSTTSTTATATTTTP